ncbi:hypothetical protein BH23PLA1_BH23PLA1_19700 [soil metagenome]
MKGLIDFERLEKTVLFVRRHPEFPGKESVVDDCLVDIDDRHRQGDLDDTQREVLRKILLESPSMAG